MAEKGIEITMASPKGGVTPIDPDSLETAKNEPFAISFLQDKKDLYSNTLKIADLVGKTGDFDAVFFPGGAGPMWDLAVDKDSQALIAEFYEAGKPVAAVCHAPAVLQGVTMSNGKYLVDGKTVTGLSDAEEVDYGWEPYVPFSLERRLQERGAKYVKAVETHGEKLAVDGNLITGQNIATARKVGEAIVQALSL